MTMQLELKNSQILEKEILDTKNSLSTERMDMSFGEIMSMYERDELVIDPEYQRLFRWDNYQKTRFIESLLLGIPIPPIFVAEDTDGRWELVDGLQRVSTVVSFFGILKNNTEKNRWIMDEGDLVKSLENYSCSELPLKFQLNIKRAVCRVEIVKWNSKIDMRYELFNRLNTGGSPLSEQEIRNCIFRGISNDFNNFLKSLASNQDFIDLIEPTHQQKEQLFLEELVLRFASLYRNIDNIKEHISTHMTKFMRNSLLSNSFDYTSMENLFLSIIELLKPYGKDVFRGVNKVFSTSIYDAVTLGVANNIDYYRGNPSIIQEKVRLLKDSTDFRDLMGRGATSKTRTKRRLEIAGQIFKPKATVS